ncbi:MAG: methyltransferase domain-containing protein [Chloroflexi bacterium]|nr:methyltransferase domain-containing protein [Chloroflexota bacterium]
MKYTGSTYSLLFDPVEERVLFEGIFRPSGDDEVAAVFQFLCQLHDRLDKKLRLDFRRLRYTNAEGIKILSMFVAYARGRDRLTVEVIASGVLAWSERVLPNLRAVWERVVFTVHDAHFYDSQDLVEAAEFLPLLRNQTRILWPLEKDVIKTHGMAKGMQVADICCGCGDFSLVLYRDFEPLSILGIDHSEAAIEYARNLQADSILRNVEFQRGDATALLLPDNRFDFVFCRLSLEVFSRPELILQELVRIAKPGGRIYVTGEDYDLIDARPGSEIIRNTYNQAAELGLRMGIDLRNGQKLEKMLSAAGLDELRCDNIVVDTENTDRAAFARVVEDWRVFSVNTIGNHLRLATAEKEAMLAGYDAHLDAIRDPQGYSAWVMVACSGRKPIEAPSRG